jgi:hypothetical protein
LNREVIISLIVGASIAWGIPRLWTHLFGTRYRTEKDCRNCATKRDIALLRKLVVQLAVTAGVSPSSIADLINSYDNNSQTNQPSQGGQGQ